MFGSRVVAPVLLFLFGLLGSIGSVEAEVLDAVVVSIPMDIRGIRTQAARDRQAPAPTATEEVVPTPIPEPTRAIAPTSTPVPTPTLDPITEITANHKLNVVIPWGVVVDYLDEYEFDADLVLAVMAAESGGDPSVVSYAGACGLMQVIWKSWYGISENDLCGSNWANIRLGMRILDGALEIAQEQGLDMRYGLAYYNCSEESVHADMCGSHGGLNYADNIFNFWLPRVRARIAECSEKYGEDFWTNSDGLDRSGCNW